MTTQLTVASSANADSAGAVPQVVASLPVSLHPATDTAADLVAVDGSADWPQAVERAIAAGARGVLVVRPGRAEVGSTIERATTAGVPVVIDSLWAHNPAVQDSAARFAGVADDRALLEARVYVPTGSDWNRVLLDQLALIRTAVSPVVHLEFVRRGEHGYAALAKLASGSRASISAVRTDAMPESAILRIIKPEHMVELEVPSPVTAFPGRVRVSGPEGSTLLETKWESAHRVAWRRLHGLAEAGETAADLADFAADQAIAAG